jgi:hypothetical protein
VNEGLLHIAGSPTDLANKVQYLMQHRDQQRALLLEKIKI